MPRKHYVQQRDLVDGLMDFHARMIERAKEDHAELRRLTALALRMEQQARRNGNPDAVRFPDALRSEAATPDLMD